MVVRFIKILNRLFVVIPINLSAQYPCPVLLFCQFKAYRSLFNKGLLQSLQVSVFAIQTSFQWPWPATDASHFFGEFGYDDCSIDTKNHSSTRRRTRRSHHFGFNYYQMLKFNRAQPSNEANPEDLVRKTPVRFRKVSL